MLKNKSKWILAELVVIKLHVWNKLKGAQFNCFIFPSMQNASQVVWLIFNLFPQLLIYLTLKLPEVINN